MSDTKIYGIDKQEFSKYLKSYNATKQKKPSHMAEDRDLTLEPPY